MRRYGIMGRDMVKRGSRLLSGALTNKGPKIREEELWGG